MNSNKIERYARSCGWVFVLGVTVLLLGACAGSVSRLKDESLQDGRADGAAGGRPPSDYRAYVAFLRATDLDRVGEVRQAEKWLRKALDYDPGSPTLYLRHGAVLAELRRFDDAIEETRRAIELDPTHYVAYLQLGDLLQTVSKPEAAEQAFRKAIEIDPDREDGYLDLAYLYRVREDSEKGLEVLEELRARHGTLSVRATLLEAALYKDLDRRGEAEAAFLYVLDEYPELRQAQKALLDLYLLDGDLHVAADRLEKVYQARPWMTWIPAALVEIYARLGDVEAINRHLKAEEETDAELAEELRLQAVDQLATRREFDKAMAVLEPMLDESTENYWALFYAGYLYARRQDLDKALEMYARIPVTSELYPDALESRALTLDEMGRVDEAVSLLESYLQEEPDADDVKYTLIGIYSRAKQYRKAMEAIDAILAVRPEEPRAIVQKAFVLDETGRTDDAVALLKEKIRTRKDHIRFYEALALILADSGKVQEAIGVLQDALKVDPENISLRFSLGTYYSRLEMHDEAIAQMRKILELDENNSEALNFIGYTWAELGIRLDDAEVLIKRALELDPNNGYITDSLGWVYFKKQEYERAVTTLERAVQLITREPIIVEHLGDAYLEVGERAKALEAYRRAAREILEEERPDPADVERITQKRDRLERELAGEERSSDGTKP